MDRLACYHADEDPKLDSRNSSIATPIQLPRRIWNAEKGFKRSSPLTKEQRSLPNDATQLASNDSKRAHFIHIPFSAETFSAQVLDNKSPTDFLDFFAHLRVKSNEALDVDEKPKQGEWFFFRLRALKIAHLF